VAPPPIPRSGRSGPEPPQGRFITLEGIEGCGKTTQAALLADALKMAGIEALLTREPGGTPFAERVRALVLEAGEMGAESELFLYLAARADHVARRIRPALATGAWVVCDRYGDATLAYQGYGRGLPVRRLKSLLGWAGGPVPDLTVLVDVPVEVGLARAGRRGETNRLDREAAAFHQRVRTGYLTLAEAEPGRIAVVDGTATVDEVSAAVRVAVAERLGVPDLARAWGKA
jgi:dTMP kinase